MIDEKYLISLNQKCNKLRENYEYSEILESECDISYIPTKNTSFLGYKKGFYEQILLLSNGIEETDKIRANCKNYLKVFRNEEGKIVQIQNYKKGRIDCVHQAYYEDETMYLFPFSAAGGYYSTYSYVVKYSSDFVEEEYKVMNKQITYEHYEKQGKEVAYEAANYVVDGKIPFLSKERGVFCFEPFEYKQIEATSWLDEREK